MNAILKTTPAPEMTDAERELHIADCGLQMLAAYARYEQSSCFQDRADADRWRSLQAEAIKGRSAGWIAAMERATGLSNA